MLILTCMDTPGREQLLAVMAERGLTQSEVARQLGLDSTAVNRWASGKSRPSETMRRAVRMLFGVDEDEWLTAEERARLAELSTGPEAA